MYFEEGDLITVVMARNDCFGFRLGPTFLATIEKVPYNTGDLWHIAVRIDHGIESKTVIIALNPMASDFIGFFTYQKEEE